MAVTLARQGTGSRAVATPSVQTTLPNLPATPNFIYRYNPARWQFVKVDADYRLLPLLGKMVIEPGVGGVDKRGDYTRAVAKGMQDGWVNIPQSLCPPDMTPDGQPGYVRATDSRHGTHHHDAFVTIGSVGPRAKTTPNMAAYYRWLSWLVDEGHIPQPDPMVMEVLVDKAAKNLERKIGAAGSNQRAAGALVPKLATFDAMIKLAEEMGADISPAASALITEGRKKIDELAEPTTRTRTKRGKA